MTRHMTNNAVTSHHVRLVAIYKENDMDYYLERKKFLGGMI